MTVGIGHGERVVDALVRDRARIESALRPLLMDRVEIFDHQIEGRVATLKKTREDKMHVGIEFTDLEKNFWHMVFPAPGAKPLRRQNATRETVAARG